MNQTIKHLSGAAIAAALTMSGLAGAAPRDHAPPPPPRGGDFLGPAMAGGPGLRLLEPLLRMERMADELELSDDQREAVRATLWSAMDELRPILEELGDNRRALRESGRADRYDAAAIQTLAETQGALTTDLIIAGARLRASLGEVLSPAQRERLEALRARGPRG